MIGKWATSAFRSTMSMVTGTFFKLVPASFVVMSVIVIVLISVLLPLAFPFAIPLASLVGFFCGMVAATAFGKLNTGKRRSDDEFEAKYRERTEHERIKTENKDLLRQREIDQSEIERLRGQHLSIHTIQQAFEATVLKSDQSLWDSLKLPLEGGKKGVYRGIIEVTFTRKFCIDLSKLRVCESGGRLVVYLPPVWSEIHNEKFVEHLDEVVTPKGTELLNVNSWVKAIRKPNFEELEVLADNQHDCKKLHKEQKQSLMERLRQELPNGDQGMQAAMRQAEIRVRSILSPVRMPIQFVAEEVVNGQPLEEFAEQHNRRIGDQLSQLGVHPE